MSECINKDIGKLLHAYELGQLDENDCTLFEEHLMECNFCFEEAKKSHAISRMILADKENKKNIDEIIGSIDDKDKIIELKSKRKWPGVLKLSIAVAAVIVLLIISPWKLEFSPSQEAVAFENLMAVMYFDNMAEPAEQSRSGEIITDILINDLSESDFISVVSSQRIYDILKLLGNEGLKKINKDIATQVAKKSNAKYMLTGSLIQIEPNVILTAQIVEIKSGNIIASQRVIGDDDNLFPTIDKLSEEIKVDLTLPNQAYSEIDRSACEISSCSIDAYNYYLEGLDYYNKYYYPEAAEKFAKAIKADSMFCVAYYNRAKVTYGNEQREMISRAYKLKKYASKKERRYIEAFNYYISMEFGKAASTYHKILLDYPDEKEAHWQLGILYRKISQANKAVQHFKESINIDPLFKMGYNELAITYDFKGDFDNCIKTYDKYIEMSPNEPNAYDSRGEAYIIWGYPDKGIADFKKVIELKPDFYITKLKLAALNIIDADYNQAEIYINNVLENGSDFQKYDAAFLQYLIPFRKGQINTTNEKLLGFSLSSESGVMIDEGSIFNEFSKQSLQVSIHRGFDRTKKALKTLATALRIGDENDPDKPKEGYRYYLYLILLAEAGYFERATGAVEKFKEYIGDRYSHVFYYQYLIAAGALEFNKGKTDKAIVYLEEAASRSDNRNAGKYELHYYLGKCYQKQGDNQSAIDEYKKALSRYVNSRLTESIRDIEIYKDLGICYEQVGDIDNAIKNYRIIIDLWKDADEELKQKYGYKEIEDIISRLETQI